MSDDIRDFPLFELLPRSPSAIEMHNRAHCHVPEGPNSFVVMAKQTSRRRKGMITFGVHMDCDVCYELVPYDRHICTFTLTSSGDLVLVDEAAINEPLMSSHPVTRADSQNQPRALEKSSMSNDANLGPCAGQRRVIPMSDVDRCVEVGPGCIFAFRWRVPLAGHAIIASAREHLARIYAACPQQYNIEDPLLDKLAREALNHPLHARPLPEMHCYGSLRRRDMGGCVRELVELRSGKVYAVKRLFGPHKGPKVEERVAKWKSLAKLQSERFDSLDYHSNIHLPQLVYGLAGNEPWLDWYYDLYQGNARDYFAPLILPPKKARLFDVYSAVVDQRMRLFVEQTLPALAYLEVHGMVHGNIKPENVLYTTTLVHYQHQPPGKSVRFVLVDFAFGATGTQFGTLGYMAPETLETYKVSHKADLYALGVTMLELLGVFEVSKLCCGIKYWNSRMKALTGKTVCPDAEERYDDTWRYGHRQVQELCEHRMLSVPLLGMLQLE
ncbi:kinase-like domain [Cordyceps militaris]|uniref:non-specific serine/threonine protein kinase n=1 Tax=Cordyceps militaris TaxID=73501 RepID=A0A2H4SGR7_CORMI|nr:kinase-like domain [Cordyceps militaris]